MRYITAGDNHTCIVLSNNSVKCFGMGADGQLGNGTVDNIGDSTASSVATSSAVSLGTGRTVRSISAGAAHTCVLLDNATVKCWGSGLYGRLGYEDSIDRGNSTGQMGDSLPAVSLGTGRTALQVSVGSQHSCALLDNYSVKCWGRGTYGQLGIGSTATIGDGAGEMGDSLVAVAFASGRTARSIAAGSNHTCAILDNASVVCWGRGSSGQLGQGAITNIGHSGSATVALTPAIDLGSGRTAIAISAGDAHTCAILDNATVECWGFGSNGRLGSGTTNNLGDGAGEMGNSLLAVNIGDGRTARAISAGIAHTCVVLDDASVKCWGEGTSGRLGYGNQNSLGDGANEMGANLAAVALGTGRTALAISAGGTHTCAVLDNATLKCWGDGSSGQIGSSGIASSGASANEMGDALAVVALGSSANIATEPTAPQSVVAVAGNTQATLSWAAPASSGGSAITDYVVEYSVQSSGVWSVLSDGVSTSLSATVTGLVNDTSYSFRVSALNVVNTGAVALSSTSVTPVTTTTTTTTTTTIATTTTTTTVATTTTLAARGVATTTTVAPTSLQTTTVPTTSIPTTTVQTNTTIAQATSTTSALPQLVIARMIPTIVVQPFALNISALNTVQLDRLVRYSANLKRGDTVTCTSYSPSNAFGVVSRINVQRARTVCNFLSTKVNGLQVRLVSAFAPTAPVRSSTAGSNPDWQSLNLLRRVVVEARPGT
jgi:alpha-tubulin suppressor-like RCC1 family protein